MSKTITVKMAIPSADEVESLYKLFHAAEAAEDRWNRESSEQFLERLDDRDISDEERAFIAVAWDSLVQGHGGFGRFMGAYDTLIYNFQDPNADHVAIHPKFNALLTESELLPVVLDGYTDARNTIAELENERDAALRRLGTLLFATARPAEIQRHIYSMLVNDLRDVPTVGCKRALIIGVLHRHGVIAEPVQSDPPAAK